MAHYSLVVVGLNIHEQMAPFLIHSESEPYPMYLQEFEIEKLEREYSVSRNSIPEFTKCLRDFMKLESGYNDDGYYYISTLNPKGKCKQYEIGGRWTGCLSVKRTLSDQEIFNLRSLEDRLKNGIRLQSVEGNPEESLVAKPTESFALHRQFTVAQKKDIDFAKIEMYYNPNLRNAKYGNFLAYAILKDYQWYDKGRLGVHPYPGEVEKTDRIWIGEWTEILDSVDEEEFLTILDCEI
jgi:hypothetical protein